MRIVATLLVAAMAGCIDVRTFRTGDEHDSGITPADASVADAPSILDAPAMIDAAGADAFSLASCPSSYGIEVGASRYRRLDSGSLYEDYLDACADDSPGLTHMVVISDAAEALGLASNQSICPQGIDCPVFWTGVSSTDGINFASITGEAFYANWDTGQPGDLDEPPIAVLYDPLTLTTSDRSYAGTLGLRTLCECDGRPATMFSRRQLTAPR